jgi:hypothetical protein
VVSQEPEEFPALGNIFLRNIGYWQLSLRETFKSVHPQGLFCAFNGFPWMKKNPKIRHKQDTFHEALFSER